ALLERLGARTLLEVAANGPGGPSPLELAAAPGAPEGLTFRVQGDVLVAESARGAEPLPELLRWLLDLGASVRDVRVRRPDLADAFRELTGATLDPGAEARS